MMKESTKSIKYLFLIIGVFFLVFSIISIIETRESLFDSIMSITVGSILIFFGFLSDYFIKNKPIVLKLFVIIIFGLAVISNILKGAFGPVILSLVIASYLYYQIHKLSKNYKPKQ